MKLKITFREVAHAVLMGAILGLVLAWLSPAHAAVNNTPQPLTKYYSEEGESKRDFILRIAPELRAWTLANKAEQCGWIATDGKRFGVVMMTIHSQIMCLANSHPMEMTKTGELIHTHPRGGTYKLGRSDQIRMGGVTMYTILPESFSQGDIDAGPGYLVTPTTVLYQVDGKGGEL